MPRNKKDVRRGLKRIARFHFWVMFFIFVSYLGFGFSIGPQFFVADITHKIRVLADDLIVVTATVLPPPAKPIVTATATCVSGSPRIVLDWADDSGSTSFDIERDSAPLTTGLTASTYTDTAVAISTSYTYVVTAYGPMGPGTNTSDPVTGTTTDCANVIPAATVLIETVDDEDVRTDRTDIDVSSRRPKVTGTTNMANAIIDITTTNPDITTRTGANANGYFEWVPPVKMDGGNHILTVTATDPNDATRTATDSFIFHSGDFNRDDTKDNEEEENNVPVISGPPLDFLVRVGNIDGLVFQGDPLEVKVQSLTGAFPAGFVLGAVIVDEEGNDLFRFREKVDGSGETEISISQDIPLSLEPGAYRVRVDGYVENRIVSREAKFSVRAWPLIDFGGGAIITYQEVASYLGTAFFSLLSLFFLLLLFFVREYWLYIHAIRSVTEQSLKKLGVIAASRKGVVK